MSWLGKRNQKESLEKLDKEGKRQILYAQILAVLGTNKKPLTAREIAIYIGRYTRQDIQPRLTELKQRGAVEEAGKKHDSKTDRNVTAYVLGGESI